MHVASIVFAKVPDDHNLILHTAIKGTKNVLEACGRQKIPKVILTSSCAAITCSNDEHLIVDSKSFTKENCGHLYDQSKLLAEKTAWDIAKQYNMNLSTICPGVVLGEMILHREAPSLTLLKMIMKSPFYLNCYMRIVSAYDVALAHVRCLERPEISKGQRYILVENNYYMGSLAKLLREKFSPYGYRFGYFSMPLLLQNFVCNLMGVSMDRFRTSFVQYDTSATRNDLDVKFLSLNRFVIDAVYSMIKHGEIPNKIDQGKKST